MYSGYELPLVALALLAVSWAWTGDWMLDRGRWMRWARLGLLLVGAFAVVFAVYVNERMRSVPAVSPAFAANLKMHTPTPVPDAENAAGLYLEAIKLDQAIPGRLTVALMEARSRPTRARGE